MGASTRPRDPSHQAQAATPATLEESTEGEKEGDLARGQQSAAQGQLQATLQGSRGRASGIRHTHRTTRTNQQHLGIAGMPGPSSSTAQRGWLVRRGSGPEVPESQRRPGRGGGTEFQRRPSKARGAGISCADPAGWVDPARLLGAQKGPVSWALGLPPTPWMTTPGAGEP